MVLEAYKQTEDKDIIEGVKTLAGVDKSSIEKMLDAIDEEYGSMDKYL